MEVGRKGCTEKTKPVTAWYRQRDLQTSLREAKRAPIPIMGFQLLFYFLLLFHLHISMEI